MNDIASLLKVLSLEEITLVQLSEVVREVLKGSQDHSRTLVDIFEAVLNEGKRSFAFDGEKYVELQLMTAEHLEHTQVGVIVVVVIAPFDATPSPSPCIIIIITQMVEKRLEMVTRAADSAEGENAQLHSRVVVLEKQLRAQSGIAVRASTAHITMYFTMHSTKHTAHLQCNGHSFLYSLFCGAFVYLLVCVCLCICVAWTEPPAGNPGRESLVKRAVERGGRGA